jgi:predicted double-glycine peptidase
MNSCGGACVHSIFKYYGSDIPEHKINRLVKVRREGADPENIVSMAREFGMESEYLINQDLQTLLEYVGKGIPCIVAVVAWGNEEKDYSNKKKDGHYIIAIGYDSTKIYFEDPVMLHGKGYMSLYDFLHRWHDLDGDGIIVTIHKPGAKPVVREKPSDFFCIP